MKLYSFCNREIRDIDRSKGIVSFYFATFGNKNAHNEIILDASPFKKTVAENMRRIKHFRNHNSESTIGVLQEVNNDTVGMFGVSKILQTTEGRDTMIKYEAGAITEHSYGFNKIQSDTEIEPGSEVLKEVRLWELSTLDGWGSDEFTAMKELRGAHNIEQIVRTLESIENILHRTSISDEGAKILEHRASKLNELVVSLRRNEQPQESTAKPKEPIANDFSFDLSKFKQGLNNHK